MHKAQQNFLNYLSAVEQAVQKTKTTGQTLNIDLKPVTDLEASIRSRELLVPVVGAYSAGKSSLLNAIIGTDILPVAITPETAIPTELRHDSRERLEALFADGRSQEFRVEELPALQARAAELECVRLYINRPALQALAPLVLVDMPGFNSPLDAHNKAISRYIGEGAHYLFVVSVEEGAIHSATLGRIEEIANMGRSFSVCINKADLRPPEDVEKICTYITERLEDENLTANVCAVSQNDASSVQALLSDIDPNKLFAALFKPTLQQQHRALDGVLQTALDGLQHNKATNDKAVQEMEEALRALEQERSQKTQALSGTNLEGATDDLLSSVRNRLNRSVDSMAQAMLRGGQDEMARIVSDEVRSGLIEGARRVTDSLSAQMVADFSLRATSSLRPEIRLSQDWTDALLQTLHSNLLPALLSTLGGGNSGKDKASGTGIAVLVTAVSTLGKSEKHPILQVVLALLPTLLDSLFGRISEGQKLEKIKETIRTQVLPDIERRLRPEVGNFLIHAQQQALQMVADSFENQIKAQKDMLAKVSQDIAAENKDALIAVVQNARAELNALEKTHF